MNEVYMESTLSRLMGARTYLRDFELYLRELERTNILETSLESIITKIEQLILELKEPIEKVAECENLTGWILKYGLMDV